MVSTYLPVRRPPALTMDDLAKLQRENADLRYRCDFIMKQHGERLSELARLRESAKSAAKAAIMATPDAHLISRDILVHNVCGAIDGAIND